LTDFVEIADALSYNLESHMSLWILEVNPLPV